MDSLDAMGFWSHEGALTLEERAYRCLHDAITTGTLSPGTRLVGSKVAARLGVSRTTTANAIKRLATEGLVVYRPHSDATVSSLDEAALHEVFQIRHALEDVIMREAAQRIDDTTLDRLARINDDITRSIADEDPDSYRRLERDYHMQIYAAANMPTLAAIVTELWNRIEPYRGRRYSGKALLDSTLCEHREIEAALKARDDAAAIRAMRVHVQTGHDQIAAVLQREAEARPTQSRPVSTPRRSVPKLPTNVRRSPSGSLRAAFDILPDQRRRQGKMFDLAGVLALTSCAMLCGARSRYAVTHWGRHCHPEIRVALGLPRTQGPSVATIHRVLTHLDEPGFEQVVARWIADHGFCAGHLSTTSRPDLELRGTHGEKLPGVEPLANLAEAYRSVQAGQPSDSSNTDHLLALPALILAGEQDRASMHLAIIELQSAIIDRDRDAVAGA